MKKNILKQIEAVWFSSTNNYNRLKNVLDNNFCFYAGIFTALSSLYYNFNDILGISLWNNNLNYKITKQNYQTNFGFGKVLTHFYFFKYGLHISIFLRNN